MKFAEQLRAFVDATLGPPKFEFRIYRKALSQNRARPNHGAMRFGYKTERRRWIASLSQLVQVGFVAPAEGPRVVRITREYGKREYDYGNLVGGLKSAIDAMQKVIKGGGKTLQASGMIVDDAPKYFTPLFEQRKSPDGEDAVYFEIWDEVCAVQPGKNGHDRHGARKRQKAVALVPPVLVGGSEIK